MATRGIVSETGAPRPAETLTCEALPETQRVGDELEVAVPGGSMIRSISLVPTMRPASNTCTVKGVLSVIQPQDGDRGGCAAHDQGGRRTGLHLHGTLEM